MEAPEGAQSTASPTPAAAPAPSDSSAQGLAARQLLSSLVNAPELCEIKRHQASTLSELAKLNAGLTALNKRSADEYARSAAQFLRAARLASTVKSDLNDISRRIAALQRKLAALQPAPGPGPAQQGE